MKKTLTTIIALLSLITAFAQGVDDACLFSQTYYQGTAKATGMGNALGAVGGDMTSVCINPAGMGIYRSSEFTTSLSLMDNYHSSNYYGTDNGANKMRLSIPNIGFVSAKQKSNYRPLRFTQFGIGLTRTNDFNMHTLSKGINPSSSKIDSYLTRIDGFSPDDLHDAFPYDIYPAWSTYLIDLYEDELGEYYGSPVPQGNIWQGQECEFKGRSESWTFAGSANYRDRLFLGASLDLTHIKRVGTRTFSESRVAGTETEFNQWHYKEDLSSNAIGVNLKAGLIFHATPWFRLGAAFHSPTLYSFDESWQTETESQILGVTRKSLSQEANYEYNFISPLKWVGSMAFIVNERGIISLDAEYTNYGAARFKTVQDDDYDYTPTNNGIKDTFGKTYNFRLGTEWLLGSSYLRFGAAYYGSPFGLGETSGSVKKASCGISVPVSHDTTFDFAYELTYGKTYHTLYDAGELGIEPVTQKQFKNLVSATLKVRF
ncbi:MAG: outer membrane protein transport protein [Bacteroidales bacterium]|nr:outer membrane protein transport protein [Bacteroidales bacterium]